MPLPTVDLTGSLTGNLHGVLREAAQKGRLATDEITSATVVLRQHDLETLAHDQRLNEAERYLRGVVEQVLAPFVPRTDAK